MRDTESVRCPLSVLIDPPQCDPIANKGDIPGHLNSPRLKLPGLERQTLAGLGCNPVGNVILTHGRGTNRRPTEEIFVP